MPFPDHAAMGAASLLPAQPPLPVFSIAPVTIPYPNRPVDLQLRVSAPVLSSTAAKQPLPIVIISHGMGRSNWLNSLAGYEPLTHYWASQGFVVLLPTHLAAVSLGLPPPAADNGMFWQDRPGEISFLIDHLDTLETLVPQLQGRLDKTNIAVAGHSLGGFTASLLLGATNTSPITGTTVRAHDPRVKAGVVLGGTGHGGDSLSDNGRKMVPFYDVNFDTMRTPALIMAGDADLSPHLTDRGPDWHWDGYTHAPGPKDLFKVRGGGHGFGGVAGWSAAETDDESPERLAVVQRVSSAYLRTALYGDDAWARTLRVVEGHPELGAAESK
ncbi:Alpha/Beta hydrolase protein [Emericellopsis atlantica]|uniref:1-alkyl-2-acetylglycerophosphocholine esterase n=1 Tax=Emericellopsis atlantica TaxID=2614577 RepID=A0A9P7ZQK6_9HYPO|nr:Alpha/Beta hydrolase protein [Emericellopsis atlantica]KAG9255843.1 Alpha/Beta hydrolase protein [Emericellopsis atlantica]